MIRLFPSIMFLLLLAGCSENKQKAADDSIMYADEKIVNEKINNHSGKILLINVWATWCVPCVEEFPDLVRIHNDYRDKGLDFLSLSVDFGGRADSLVKAFMKSARAEFPVFIVREDASEKVINLLSPEWSGAIPATFIYGGNGEQKKFILGAQTYDFFKQSIDSLLLL